MSEQHRIFVVDAFSRGPFTGNPAAVVPLERGFLDDDVMQAIAAENNLSETAFVVPGEDAFQLRWFTPTIEVDLCGHATLASGHVILDVLERGRAKVAFETQAGRLEVHRGDDGRLLLDFPARPPTERPLTADDERGLGLRPAAFLAATKAVAVLASADAVRAFVPDLDYIRGLDTDGLIVTAPGDPGGPDACDFVSRYFAPHAGIDEDPVTGSAHCTLAPYWADILGKTELLAHQVSARSGVLRVAVAGDRVRLEGQAVTTLRGELTEQALAGAFDAAAAGA